MVPPWGESETTDEGSDAAFEPATPGGGGNPPTPLKSTTIGIRIKRLLCNAAAFLLFLFRFQACWPTTIPRRRRSCRLLRRWRWRYSSSWRTTLSCVSKGKKLRRPPDQVAPSTPRSTNNTKRLVCHADSLGREMGCSIYVRMFQFLLVWVLPPCTIPPPPSPVNVSRDRCK